MSTDLIFIIIIFSAMCHAVWSAIIKSSSNPLSLMGITSILELLIFLPLTFFVPFPIIEIWYLLFATIFIHVLYRLNVIYSYKFGDLSFVYPIARGGSSLLIAIISILFLQNSINLFGFLGVIIVCVGLFLISFSSKIKFNKPAFFLAVSTAIFITTYTLIDGIGVRSSENAFSYIFWLIALNGVPILFISIFSKNGLRKKESYSIKAGIAAGIFATLSYALVVWSMQFIEIAYVSGIREVSIVFATIIGMLFLSEKYASKRIIPSILIALGIATVYFQI
ncbi:MAG: hypothetical protein CFH17_00922 [Alphaproteobacteria bacterium MarineAlpha5_Bin7]|nr:MAG: hypothetical protein CFH17_00922 [Alphaproteobacteria bacterium MarineAlpha5_Bin7]